MARYIGPIYWPSSWAPVGLRVLRRAHFVYGQITPRKEQTMSIRIRFGGARRSQAAVSDRVMRQATT